MSAITDPCKHGESRATCLDCLYDAPTAPDARAPEQLLTASRWIVARFNSRCGHKYAHEVAVGDRLGWCDEIGAWVCERCAR